MSNITLRPTVLIAEKTGVPRREIWSLVPTPTARSSRSLRRMWQRGEVRARSRESLDQRHECRPLRHRQGNPRLTGVAPMILLTPVRDGVEHLPCPRPEDLDGRKKGHTLPFSAVVQAAA